MKSLNHSDLSQFTGTTTYYRYLGNFLLTDGVKYLADAGQQI
ncbi:DUF6876 family protein [Rhodoferax sp.]|nr:DUF6876 family protein [Rhodoferax sp.]MDD3937387.1 hypothetical protein [Rhodoferax sp.]